MNYCNRRRQLWLCKVLAAGGMLALVAGTTFAGAQSSKPLTEQTRVKKDQTELDRRNEADKAQQPKLARGVYRVFKQSERREQLRPKKGQIVVAFARPPPKGKKAARRQFVLISKLPNVPLDLAKPPQLQNDGKDAVRVLLELKPNAARKLRQFTTKNKDVHVAVVVDNTIVAVLRSRGPITAGKLQITSCEKGALKKLAKELSKQ